MQVESVRFQKLDPGAPTDRRELLRNRMHGVPQTRQPQAIIRVQPALSPIVLHQSMATALITDAIAAPAFRNQP
jgi:hypothetical protein